MHRNECKTPAISWGPDPSPRALRAWMWGWAPEGGDSWERAAEADGKCSTELEKSDWCWGWASNLCQAGDPPWRNARSHMDPGGAWKSPDPLTCSFLASGATVRPAAGVALRPRYRRIRLPEPEDGAGAQGSLALRCDWAGGTMPPGKRSLEKARRWPTLLAMS
jgi:hypothetical protein